MLNTSDIDINSTAYQREKKQTYIICVVVIIAIILFLMFL